MNGPTPTIEALRQCVASTHSPGSSVVFARVSSAGTTLGRPLAMHDGDAEAAVMNLLAEVAEIEAQLAALQAASIGTLLRTTADDMRERAAMQVFIDAVRSERMTPIAVAALVELDAALRKIRGLS